MRKLLLCLSIFATAFSVQAQMSIGINTPDASAQLDVSSTLKGFLAPRMTLTERDLIASPATGLLIYQNDNTPGFYFFDGTNWQPIASGSWVDLTTDQMVNGKKTFISDYGLLATGAGLGSGTIPIEGFGYRMMWYPGKAAFRAGYVAGDQWDDAKIGNYSIAFGTSTTASGQFSTAFGSSTTASGTTSTAMGFGTTASATRSTALGSSTTANGESSTAMGLGTTARSFGETVLGTYNTSYTIGTSGATQPNATDRLFVIGNGTSVTAKDALVMLKNGNTTFSGTVTATVVAPTSDARLKRNIVPLKNGVEALMQLNPVSYEKKNSLYSTEYNIKENGFIAQELQKVMPTLVLESTDQDKLLSVNYTGIIPVLTKAIQEQQKAILDQQKQIADLKKMVESLIKK
jgi:hypothetical protein